MIILFDIDGTLLTCGGSGRRALARAFAELLDAPQALDGVRLAGSTDPIIVAEAHRAVTGRAPTDAEHAAIMARYLDRLDDELQAAGSRYRVYDGVRALLDALSARPEYLVGLATGNDVRGAEKKLAHGGIDTYFGFGGYGSDAAERWRLVAAGIARGRAAARARGIPRVDDAAVIVIGDTEHDVTAARRVGARAVGVREGSGHVDALTAAAPDLLVDDLRAPALWRLLGLDA
jgi:phosphoglycolate phosphatase